jgi:nucleoside-diphosphate-sugar epimerase
MTAPRRIIAVTGANGYIGTRLCRAAVAAGWDVVAFSRSRPTVSGCRFVPYDLAGPFEQQTLAGAQALIHLAADTQHTEPDPDIERQACRRLIEAVDPTTTRLIFVSSQAAAANAPTGYGRVKWELERLVLNAGGIVVRPGMVYGGPEGGLFGRLCDLVKRLPALPAFFPPPQVQPVHVDDLAQALLSAATGKTAQILEIANSEPISFTSFLKAIARHRVRKPALALPIPTRVVVLMLHVGFWLTRNPALQPSRFFSLLTLRTMETAGAMTAIGLKLRSLADGMHPSGSARRRQLICEGHSLLLYLAGTKPNRAMIARYASAIERFDGGTALHLRGIVHAWPGLLSLLDGPTLGGRDIRLERRIDIAFQIAEASVLTKRFLLLQSVPMPIAFLQIVYRASIEAAFLVLRPFLGPLLHPRTDRQREISGP